MKRIAMLIAVVAGAIVASKLLVEDMMGIALEPAVMSWLDNAGIGSAAVIVGLLAADVLLPIPSSIIMILSGAAFGAMWGSVLALVGSIAGEWLGFELVRRYGRGMANRLGDEHEIAALDRVFQRYGAAAIVITRPLPIAMETMSLVAGLTAMSRRVFLTASLIGTAPIVLIYAWAGARSREVGHLLPAVIMLVAVSGGGWLWYQARGARGPNEARK
jgi:uncharacterized membrane protein YdjX (TVP38/TMEM64 family)